jgi:acarbose 7IV-phosphotransferase
MARILVSGLINIETTLRVDRFPIDYTPVRYPFWDVATTVSGVGYNVAKALTVLGDEVPFLSLIGHDLYGDLVITSLERDRVPAQDVRADLIATPQSVILYDGEGRRQINVDLKDIQERTYPRDALERALEGCDLAVLCNINFSRPFLALARERGVPIATDVHAISSLDDDYNRDWLAAADILFMSDELLPTSPDAWARQVLDRYPARIVVIGLGSQGALLAQRDPMRIVRLPAVETRPIVNTIGAGDALFSAFVHTCTRMGQACTRMGQAGTRAGEAYAALQRAMVFASYKIGEKGAAEGFLTESQLETWYRQTRAQFPVEG